MAGPPAPALPEKELLASRPAPHSNQQRSFGKVRILHSPCAEDAPTVPAPAHVSSVTDPAISLEIVQTGVQEGSQDRTKEHSAQAGWKPNKPLDAVTVPVAIRHSSEMMPKPWVEPGVRYMGNTAFWTVEPRHPALPSKFDSPLLMNGNH